MKKIMIVTSGSPGGNTDALSQALMSGAKESGCQVVTYALNGHLEGCSGCRYCQSHDHRCAIADRMQELYQPFLEADVLVLASPLYFWSISGRLKCFIDRLYALSTNDCYPAKETFLLMTGGSNRFYAFEQAVSFYRFFTKALGWKDRGMVLAYGCHGDPKAKYISEDYLHEAYQTGKKMGEEDH